MLHNSACYRVICRCCLRNNYERRLCVVRLIRPYPGHVVSDGVVGADSDTDSDEAASADADESIDELLSVSESFTNQSSAPHGEHL